MAQKSQKWLMAAWFFMEMVNIFGYQAFLVLMYYFADKCDDAGRNGEFVRNFGFL